MGALSATSYVSIPLSGPNLESLRQMRLSRDGKRDPISVGGSAGEGVPNCNFAPKSFSKSEFSFRWRGLGSEEVSGGSYVEFQSPLGGSSSTGTAFNFFYEINICLIYCPSAKGLTLNSQNTLLDQVFKMFLNS